MAAGLVGEADALLGDFVADEDRAPAEAPLFWIAIYWYLLIFFLFLQKKYMYKIGYNVQSFQI